ncbi:MAG: hypothetical protein Q7T20_10060 [Saprospiraceae bacterium]|nr:hypothetical protein [Saprospiraceae bacterium]
MNQRLFWAFWLLGTTNLSAQSLLEDALVLRDYFNVNALEATANRASLNRGVTIDGAPAAILEKYLNGVELNTETLVEAFANNPFLRIQDTDQNPFSIGAIGSLESKSSAPAGASGFSVTNLADGLSRFLVKRTKQELSMAFFNDFKRKMAEDKYLGNFCPLTKAQLDLIDSEVYQFNDYLESLREAFTADMTALPGSMERYLRDPELCDNCIQKAEGKILTDLLHIGQQMVNGEPPIDMINYLADRSSAAIQTVSATKEEAKLYNMAGGIRFLNLISESFRDPAAMEDSVMPWRKSKEIREIFRDPIVLRIYLGLLWQKVDDIQFVDQNGASTSLRSLISNGKSAAELVDGWRRSIESLSEMTHALQYSLHASLKTETTVADDFFSYSQSITDLLQSVNQTGRILLNRGTEDIIPSEYILLMRQCNSLYFNVRQRNFAGAVGNVIYCLNLVNEDLLAKSEANIMSGGTMEEQQKAIAQKAKAEKARSGIATLLKYANFIAAVAEASSPEEMERAIELFALPPGSSRMKKVPGRFSVALNAYTGLFAAAEYLEGDTEPKTVSGVAAPLGISCAWGLGKAGSLGFFVPLIDVGAVTAYRFDGDNSENLPELSWANIISPGLYAVYDFGKQLPFSFGLGWQSGPNLRKITRDGVSDKKSGNRLGAFVTVDIPITYLYLGKGNN